MKKRKFKQIETLNKRADGFVQTKDGAMLPYRIDQPAFDDTTAHIWLRDKEAGLLPEIVNVIDKYHDQAKITYSLGEPNGFRRHRLLKRTVAITREGRLHNPDFVKPVKVEG